MAKVKYQIRYKARYRKKGANNPFDPFLVSPGAVGASVTVAIDEDVPIKKVREMAKAATPGCYGFIEVRRIR